MITVPTDSPVALSAGIDEVKVGPSSGTVEVVVVDVEVVVVVVDVEVEVVVDVEVDVVAVVEVERVVPVGTRVVEVLVVGEVSDASERGVVDVVVEEVGEDVVLEEEGAAGAVVAETVEEGRTTDVALGELCDVLGHIAPAMTTITSAAMKICTVPCTELPKMRFFI